MNLLVPQLLFEPSKALRNPPVAHGSAASALWVALADEAQIRTLWGGWPHLTMPCTLPTGASSAVSRPLLFAVPPLATRARVIVWAAGAGDIHLGGLTATVAGDAANTDAKYAVPHDLGELTLAHATDDALPYFETLSGWSESDVVVFCVAFVFSRHTTAL